MQKAIIFILLVCLSIPYCFSATIHGTIISSRKKEKLQGAFITCKNTKKNSNHKTVTTENGEYTIENLQPGEYEIKVEYVGYKHYSTHVTIDENETVELNITLVEKLTTLKDVTVSNKLNAELEKSSRVLEKNANNITNTISAQAMERSPDINAANVLQRMSGITIERSTSGDESYAVIRGMEPRYNTTLINGIKIASPNEKSRYVSLDIIPSDILQRIEINKSSLPEMEGDAIGGSVDMIMKDAPDSIEIRAIASVGYNQLFFDRKFTDFYKSVINPQSPSERFPSGYKLQPNDLSRGNLDFFSKQAPPSLTAGFTYGERFLHKKLGILIADNVHDLYYGSDSKFTSIIIDQYNNPDATDVATRYSSTHQLKNGLIAHIDYLFNSNNKIIVNNTLLYSNLTQARLSIDTTLNGDMRTGPGTGTVSFTDRSLSNKEFIENLKIEGKHSLSKKLLFNWAAMFSDAYKKAPDEATLTTHLLINQDLTKTAIYYDGIDRLWQHNDDKDYTGIVNLTYRSKLFHNNTEIKVGGLYRSKTRYNHEDDYTQVPLADFVNSLGKPLFTNIYDVKDSVFNPSGTGVYDPNNYRADEKVTEAYIQGNIRIKRLDIIAGVRMENTEQDFYIDVQDPQKTNFANIIYTDVLPGLHLKYALSKKENLRLSYYKSISRPNYYELVPYTIQGLDYNEQGNPNLKHTTADNFDLRYELFPRDEEQLFAGLFYKNLQNPIENGLVGSGSGQIVYQPNNYGNATNMGAEVVYTKYWKHFGIMCNYTFTHSSLKQSNKIHYYYDANNYLQKDSLTEDRPLQGQSEHILNCSFLYKNTPKAFFAQVAFEYIGKTLTEVTANYKGDYYQSPEILMSISIEKGVKKHFIVFGKFNNLLNTPVTISVKDMDAERNIYKANYSIGIRYNR